MRLIDSRPNLRRAALLVARDNGIINRHHTEDQFLDNTDSFLGAEGVVTSDWDDIDRFLSGLSEKEFTDLCIGEHQEMIAVSARAPHDHLLPNFLEYCFEEC